MKSSKSFNDNDNYYNDNLWYYQMKREEAEIKEQAELGLPYRSCSGGCSVTQEPNDIYSGCTTELQIVALFLGYKDGQKLGTTDENHFSACIQGGTSTGNPETVKNMLKEIVKDQSTEERKKAVLALKAYQKDPSKTLDGDKNKDKDKSAENMVDKDKDKCANKVVDEDEDESAENKVRIKRQKN